MIKIGSIVEGEGEVAAVPVLLRRLAALQSVEIEVARPFRIPRGKLVQERELGRVVEAVARTIGPGGPILVLLDADDDCVAQTGPALKRTAQLARPDREIAVVMPNREFEAWFLASIESLRGKRRVRHDATWVGDPESARHAKAQLQLRIDGPRYSPTVDQAGLVAHMDLAMARSRSPSFDKLCRDVERLLGGKRPTGPAAPGRPDV
ncbi:MAG: hypothetical protein RLZZ450_3803 [Pseudomonadota bacterium]|jgi:hypothetical protein